jgi:hypothetical protein
MKSPNKPQPIPVTHFKTSPAGKPNAPQQTMNGKPIRQS